MGDFLWTFCRAEVSFRLGIFPLLQTVKSSWYSRAKVLKTDAYAGWARDNQKINKDQPLKTNQTLEFRTFRASQAIKTLKKPKNPKAPKAPRPKRILKTPKNQQGFKTSKTQALNILKHKTLKPPSSKALKP